VAEVVFIVLFLVIAAIVLVPRYLKSREREQMQATLRAAIERGQPLSPELMAALSQELPAAVASPTYTAPVRVKPPATPQSDVRRGIIWLSVALALAIMAGLAVWDDSDGLYYVLFGAAVIPAMIGLAFLGLAAMNKSAVKHDKLAS
jgi:hypothetical protein